MTNNTSLINFALPSSLPSAISKRTLFPLCAVGAVGAYLFGVIAAKQRSRSNTLSESCRHAFPILKHCFYEQCWRIAFRVQGILGRENRDLEDDLVALKALGSVENSSPSNKVILSDHEKYTLGRLLSKPMSESEFDRLNAYVVSTRNEKLWKILKIARELLLPLDKHVFKSIKDKRSALEEFIKTSGGTGEYKGQKFDIQDMRVLIFASDRRDLLGKLMDAGVRFPYRDSLQDDWADMANFFAGDEMKKIKDAAVRGLKPGLLFFYDWKFIALRDFYRESAMTSIELILQGRIPHVGIIVRRENSPYMSHLNGAMGHHGFHPMGPFLATLGNLAKLDLSALIPPEIDVVHHKVLKKVFEEEFILVSGEDHPELKLKSGWFDRVNLKPYVGLASRELVDAGFKADEPLVCAGYVGTVFLKAIQAVNKKIIELGYTSTIAHPFGKHEIMDRMDIPRLLYHFQRLNILKVVPIDVFVDKVIQSPTLRKP